MPRKTPIISLKQMNEINLTPLMDLTFILLITFIITFPLIEQGISINLPKGEAESVSADNAQTVSLDDKGNLYLNDLPATIEEIENKMKEMTKNGRDVMVMFRADRGIAYGKAMKILETLHKSGVGKMALVMQKESP